MGRGQNRVAELQPVRSAVRTAWYGHPAHDGMAWKASHEDRRSQAAKHGLEGQATNHGLEGQATKAMPQEFFRMTQCHLDDGRSKESLVLKGHRDFSQF